MSPDEKAVADVQVPLWDAINRYATTCGGDPSQHVYGNTPRMTAVADTNRVIHNLAARIRADAERETAAALARAGLARSALDRAERSEVLLPEAALMLRLLEWDTEDAAEYEMCSICRQREADGHAPTCAYATLLARIAELEKP